MDLQEDLDMVETQVLRQIPILLVEAEEVGMVVEAVVVKDLEEAVDPVMSIPHQQPYNIHPVVY